MALSTEAIAAARKAGKDSGPSIVSARYRRASGKLDLEFDNGVALAVPVALIQEFALLETLPTVADLSNIEIWGGGYDLYFPRIETFVNGTALLAGILGTKAWMAMLARNLGSTRSQAKATAARENGKKGGRPRKLVIASGAPKQSRQGTRVSSAHVR